MPSDLHHLDMQLFYGARKTMSYQNQLTFYYIYNRYYATPRTAGYADESQLSLSIVLTIVQSLALGEIIHSIVGLVRSPVLITSLQVGSRIVALHMINTSPRAQGK
jgi:hypothetical protein